MIIRLLRPFKSLEPFEWHDVPDFSVITGVNGSGKSHFLRAVFDQFQQPAEASDLISVEGVTKNNSEVRLFGSNWYPSESDFELKNIVTDSREIYQRFESFQNKNLKGSRNSSEDNYLFPNILKTFEAKSIQSNYDNFKNAFLYLRVAKPNFYAENLSRIFSEYKVAQLDFLQRGQSLEEFESYFGESPWKLLTDVISNLNLPFEVSDPNDCVIGESFKFSIFNKNTKAQINFSDLSSGEQRILAASMWLYGARSTASHPSLILLDEPDAHLHPALVSDLIQIINNVFVDEYNIKVIMTTHSPSTVALSPEGSLFEIRRNPTSILAVNDCDDVIGKLTDGFSIVTKKTKFVLVEDEIDKKFYSSAYRICEKRNLLPDKRSDLVFISAGRSGKKSKESGGVTVVEKWIDKFKELAPLKSMLVGLVDKDGNPDKLENIFKIDRYCVENYLCDPLVVCGALLAQKKTLSTSTKLYEYGDESEFINEPEANLQEIVQEIVILVSSEFKKTMGVSIGFEKCSLSYPQWLIDSDGKFILSCFQENPTLGGGHWINQERLLDSFKRIKMVPDELKSLFAMISE